MTIAIGSSDTQLASNGFGIAVATTVLERWTKKQSYGGVKVPAAAVFQSLEQLPVLSHNPTSLVFRPPLPNERSRSKYWRHRPVTYVYCLSRLLQ